MGCGGGGEESEVAIPCCVYVRDGGVVRVGCGDWGGDSGC